MNTNPNPACLGSPAGISRLAPGRCPPVQSAIRRVWLRAVVGLLTLLAGPAGAQASSGNVLQPGDPIIASSANSPGSEGVANAIDGKPTKYLNFDTHDDAEPAGFVVTLSIGPITVTGLAMQSANDSPERDPRVVTLEGSNDETITDFASGHWELIVRLENIRAWTDLFPGDHRFQWQEFQFPNEKSFKHYHWTVLQTQSANWCCFQIAEVALLADTGAADCDVARFLVEPVDTPVLAGARATFFATVNGPWPLQWFQNGQPIPGATATSYTTDPVTPENATNTYAVQIVDCVTSAPVTAVIFTPSARQSIGISFIGGHADGSFTANGSPTEMLPEDIAGVHLQANWNNAANASGQSGDGTSLPGVLLDSDGHSSTITVEYATSGTWGSGVGEETPLQRLLNGLNLSSPGEPATLTFSRVPAGTHAVLVYGISPPLQFQNVTYTITGTQTGTCYIRQINSDEYNAAPGFYRGVSSDPNHPTTANYVRFDDVSPDDGRITLTWECTTSGYDRGTGPSAVQLLLNVSSTGTPPVITQQPQPTVATAGATATVTVQAAGENVRYQWRKNRQDLLDGGNIRGAATANLTIASFNDADVAVYAVIVSNPAGSVISQNASIRLTRYDIRDGLVSYWAFDETEGSTAANAVAGGQPGLVKGTAAWAAGRIGNAFTFDGKTYLLASDYPKASQGIAGAAWVKVSPGLQSDAVILRNAQGEMTVSTAATTRTVGQFELGLVWDSDHSMLKPMAAIGIGPNVARVIGTTEFPTDSWRHLAFTADGAQLRLYVDGTEVAVTDYLAEINPPDIPYISMGARLNVGSDNPPVLGPDEASPEFLTGQMDEVAVWARAVTAAEVAAICAAGQRGQPLTSVRITPPGQKLWEFQTGGYVWSSPALGTDGTVYVGSGDSKVYALDGATGQMRWESRTASAVYSSPAIGADGTVYVGSEGWRVYALNGATGKALWKFQTGNNVWPSAAIGEDGTVYVASGDARVYALDPATGLSRWEFRTGGRVRYAPAVAADGTVYVGSEDAKLYALDGATGQELWAYETGGFVSCAPAIGADGTVYVGSNDGKIYALEGTSVYALEGTSGLADSPWPKFRRDAQNTGRAPADVPAKVVQWSVNGHWYERVDSGQLSWTEAQAAAAQRTHQDLNGHLVTVTSAEENRFLTEHAALGQGTGAILEQYWLGGFQPAGSAEPAGDWRWVTGEPFGYANWGSGEPNDGVGKENALMFWGSPKPDGKVWNDGIGPDEGFGLGYIVEYEPGAGLPRILGEPADQTVVVGANVTFGVAASGTPPLTYQWRLNGSPLTGSTNASLVLNNVRLDQAGGYSAVVANSVGAVTSRVATLTVRLANEPVVWAANGHAYLRVDNGGITWTDARTAAAGQVYQGMPGHLVTVNSAEENRFVTEDLSLGGGGANLLNRRWMGGYQVEGAGEPREGWTWVTGEPFAFTNWSPAEPNDASPGEDHLMFNHLFSSDGKQWNDAPENYWLSLGYVVEYEAGSEVDVTSPTLAGLVGDPSRTRLTLTFSEAVAAVTATNLANYALSGGLQAVGAMMSADSTKVILITSTQTPTAAYTVTVNGVMDLAGNRIATDSQGSFTASNAVPPGQFLFANKNLTATPPIDAKMFDKDGTTALSGTAYWTQAYIKLATDPDMNYQPVGSPVHFRTGNNAGYIVPVVVTTPFPAGTTINVEMRLWESSHGDTYEAAVASGGLYGKTAPVTLTVTAAPNPPADMTGLQSWSHFPPPPPPPPPWITNPSDVRVMVNDAFMLSVSAVNAAPHAFQWYRDGQPLIGQHESALSVARAQLSDAGGYHVTVTNFVGSATSGVARVVVGYPLLVTTNGAGRVEVTPPHEIQEPGQQVVLKAIPEKGHIFQGWQGDVAGTVNPVTLVMDRTKQVQARFTPEDSRVKWQVAAGGPMACSPALGWDGTVYVSAGSQVLALNGSSGATKWSVGLAPLLDVSPAVGPDGTVYVGASDRHLHALDGATGAGRWAYATGNTRQSTPAVGADGTVYVGCTNLLGQATVTALDGAHGTRMWEFLTGSWGDWSLAVGADGTIYAGAGTNLFALDGQRSTRQWAFANPRGMTMALDPAIDLDGTVYAKAWNGELWAISGTTGDVIWQQQVEPGQSGPVIGFEDTLFTGGGTNVYALNVATGAVKWQREGGGWVTSAPAVAADNTVYVASGNGRLYALDGVTGAERWRFEAGSSVSGSPAIGADGTVYLGAYDGMVYALRGSGGLAPTPWPKFRCDAQNTGRSPAEPPALLRQPFLAVLTEGAEDRITVQFSGIPLPRVQWYFNGDAVPDGTNTVLQFSSVSRALEGLYALVASNWLGRATSAPIVAVVSNVDPAYFPAWRWEGGGGAVSVLASTSVFGPWTHLFDPPTGATSGYYVETEPELPSLYYRFREESGATTARFTATAQVPGWWYEAAVGTRHRIEYVWSGSGWTNWTVLTELTLPGSPQLFLDTDAFDHPSAVYRTTPVP